MATVRDIDGTPLAPELKHINALLDTGPDWNFVTTSSANVIFYTFSVSSGNEKRYSGQDAFTLAQQNATYLALKHLQAVTGIEFKETNAGADAQIHFANLDLGIVGDNVTGLCSWEAPYSYRPDGMLAQYDPDAYVYLDNSNFFAMNRDLTPGGQGYQTLLHELGHALGLKHPHHEGGEVEHVHLPLSEDNTRFTIMSYNELEAPYKEFRPYDVAALRWLYGGDGLRGALGLNSTTGGMYITGTGGADILVGTSGDDLFEGMGGADIIRGDLGTDTVQFSGARSDYTFSVNSAGDLVAAYAGGIITMSGIEQLNFNNASVRSSEVVESDTTPPAPPQIGVTKNAYGYAFREPLVSGTAEAGALIRVYAGDVLVGETQADANGVWQKVIAAFPDGLNHSVRATATDAAGNISAYSQTVSFNVDATPPPIPTMSGILLPDSNQPVFSGVGEAGTTMLLLRTSDTQEIGRTVINADGTWQITTAPLPNGNYVVSGASVDKGDSARATANTLQFTINSSLYIGGTDGNDRIAAGIDSSATNTGNNAIDGGKGLDTVVYGGSSDQYLVQRGVYGVTVTDRSGATGSDNLINVERIQFADTMVALDIEGNAGQVYRLYRALFEREPDPTGLRFWINAADSGFTLNQISEFFLNQEETYALYTDPSDEFFVRALYDHVLQREPDPSGFKYWVDGLKLVSRAQALAFFSESPENKAQVIGSIEHGFEFPLPVV